MKTTIDWINEVEKMHGLTDYALAKRLNISTAHMSRMRTGKDFLSEALAIQVAGLLGIDALPIIASAAVERSKIEHVREYWKKHAEATAAGIGAVVLAGTLLSAPVPAHAQGVAMHSEATNSVYYVNNRRRKRTRASRWVRGTTGFRPGFFSSTRQASHSHD